jgi:hypothetical protein
LWVAAVPERVGSIPEAYHDLLGRRTFAHLSAVMPDGTPHSMPVWIDDDADRVLVNTVRSRRKERTVGSAVRRAWVLRPALAIRSARRGTRTPARSGVLRWFRRIQHPFMPPAGRFW